MPKEKLFIAEGRIIARPSDIFWSTEDVRLNPFGVGCQRVLILQQAMLEVEMSDERRRELNAEMHNACRELGIFEGAIGELGVQFGSAVSQQEAMIRGTTPHLNGRVVAAKA